MTVDQLQPTEGSSIDLTDRVFEASIAAMELLSIHLGTELGLYRLLFERGPLAENELADGADINQRYAREWLEQQAVAGFLTVDDASLSAEKRRYELPAAHVAALVDPLDPGHLAPIAKMIAGVSGVLDEVIDAYRTGNGVAYECYGAHFRDGQGGVNRPAYAADLVDSWLPATSGVAEKLAAGARVADIGCGVGWSTVAMQAAWPEAEVIGIDSDRASITDARANAAALGVDVAFSASSAESTHELGPFDVALLLECLHDMSNPVEALRSLRSAMAVDGIVVLADEAVADTFTAPGDELERMMYGWSILHCLPASMAEQPSAAIGTAIRPSTVVDLALQAGFSNVEVVDVDGGFFRIYRLAV